MISNEINEDMNMNPAIIDPAAPLKISLSAGLKNDIDPVYDLIVSHPGK